MKSTNNNKNNCLTEEMNEEDFQFPYKAYSIQLQFMRNLYQTFEEKKIGIFESPTGTVIILYFHT